MLQFACLAALVIASANKTPGTVDLGRCLDVDSDHPSAYIVTDGENQTSCGDMRDDELQAETTTRGTAGAIWFRMDDQLWVIRDAARVAEAQRLFANVSDIGSRQGALGAKQGAIGAEQGRIGAQQATLALRRIGSSGTSEDDTHAAEARSARMKALGERMDILSKQQSALAHELKRELDAAQRGLSELVKQAMKDGTAVKVRRL